MARNSKIRYIISIIRRILSRNIELLEDNEVRRWLQVMYPLLLEHSSSRDKEFFKSIYPELFD